MTRRNLLVVAVLIVAACPASNANPAGASPTNHVTWTKADSPHVFPDGHFISNSTSVTVEAGAEVRMGPGAEITVEGILNVLGTAEEPVLFTSSDPDQGWGGITFQSRFPGYRSTLDGAVLEKARDAVLIDATDVVIVDSVFRSNEEAYRAFDPPTDLTLQRNVFIDNDLAVSGFTRNTISVYKNDFWNNRVNLLLEPKPLWDCGSDEGVWAITSNDILRGPVNSGLYSDDVQTPPGSLRSDYVVVATGNWWGTTDENDIRGRMTAYGECCPSPYQKEIEWRPVASEPQTNYEPPGEVPSPIDPGTTHGDPGVVTEIDAPKHNSCPRSVEALRGGLYHALGGPEKVTLALRRQTMSGCRWWNHDRQRFIEGRCQKQRWFRARVDGSRDTWRYRFDSSLPRGRYMAWSHGSAEPFGLGRNQIAFRIR